jgi:hypothetical protein
MQKIQNNFTFYFKAGMGNVEVVIEGCVFV